MLMLLLPYVPYSIWKILFSVYISLYACVCSYLLARLLCKVNKHRLKRMRRRRQDEQRQQQQQQQREQDSLNIC